MLCRWFTTIAALGRPRLRVLEPRPVDLGGAILGYLRCDRENEKQRSVPRLSYHIAVDPPPDVADNNNNMTRFEGCSTNSYSGSDSRLICSSADLSRNA